jgi:hypothetical protein
MEELRFELGLLSSLQVLDPVDLEDGAVAGDVFRWRMGSVLRCGISGIAAASAKP